MALYMCVCVCMLVVQPPYISFLSKKKMHILQYKVPENRNFFCFYHDCIPKTQNSALRVVLINTYL